MDKRCCIALVVAVIGYSTGFSQLQAQTRIARDGPTIALAFSPDGKILASGANGFIKLYDVEGKRTLKTMNSGGSRITSIAFSPDGMAIATDRETVFDNNNVDRKPLPLELEGPKVSIKGEIAIWNTFTGEKKVLASQRGYSAARLSFSTSEPFLWSPDSDGHLRKWDLKSFKESKKWRVHVGSDDSSFMTSVGTRVAWIEKNATIKSSDPPDSPPIAVQHPFPLVSLAISNDGKTLASGGGQDVRLWESSTLKPRGVIKGIEANVFVYVLAFSPDGRWSATGGGSRGLRGSNAGDIRVWDSQTLKEVAKYDGPESAVYSLAFSSDGRFLASGSFHGGVDIWRVPLDKGLPKP